MYGYDGHTDNTKHSQYLFSFFSYHHCAFNFSLIFLIIPSLLLVISTFDIREDYFMKIHVNLGRRQGTFAEESGNRPLLVEGSLWRKKQWNSML